MFTCECILYVGKCGYMLLINGVVAYSRVDVLSHALVYSHVGAYFQLTIVSQESHICYYYLSLVMSKL